MQIRRCSFIGASADPELAKAQLDLKAVCANDFAKTANAKYPKG